MTRFPASGVAFAAVVVAALSAPAVVQTHAVAKPAVVVKAPAASLSSTGDSDVGHRWP